MKWLKISALLVLTLAVMRAASWAAAWTMMKLVAAKPQTIAVVANVAAFLVFVLFLYFSLLPGEPIDIAAVLFGIAVFTIYTVIDVVWSRGTRRNATRRPAEHRSS